MACASSSILWQGHIFSIKLFLVLTLCLNLQTFVAMRLAALLLERKETPILVDMLTKRIPGGVSEYLAELAQEKSHTDFEEVLSKLYHICD